MYSAIVVLLSAKPRTQLVRARNAQIVVGLVSVHFMPPHYCAGRGAHWVYLRAAAVTDQFRRHRFPLKHALCSRICSRSYRSLRMADTAAHVQLLLEKSLYFRNCVQFLSSNGNASAKGFRVFYPAQNINARMVSSLSHSYYFSPSCSLSLSCF